MRWMVGLGLTLAVVVLINLGMLWLAVQNTPEIVESYVAEQR